MPTGHTRTKKNTAIAAPLPSSKEQVAGQSPDSSRSLPPWRSVHHAGSGFSAPRAKAGTMSVPRSTRGSG